MFLVYSIPTFKMQKNYFWKVIFFKNQFLFIYSKTYFKSKIKIKIITIYVISYLFKFFFCFKKQNETIN